MTEEELNDYYTSTRPDLFIWFWNVRGRSSIEEEWGSPTYYVIIKKGDDLKLRASSENLEELKQVVDKSLEDIYEVN